MAKCPVNLSVITVLENSRSHRTYILVCNLVKTLVAKISQNWTKNCFVLVWCVYCTFNTSTEQCKTLALRVAQHIELEGCNDFAVKKMPYPSAQRWWLLWYHAHTEPSLTSSWNATRCQLIFPLVLGLSFNALDMPKMCLMNRVCCVQILVLHDCLGGQRHALASMVL